AARHERGHRRPEEDPPCWRAGSGITVPVYLTRVPAHPSFWLEIKIHHSDSRLLADPVNPTP
ncbi:MAG: hypothetical protein WA746_21645, partial [Isosphaeraceae bacterium]